MTTQRFALVAPSLASALTARFALLKALHKKGHRILCIAPEPEEPQDAVKQVAKLSTVRGEYRPIVFNPPGLRMLQPFKVQRALKTIFSEWKPDCVLGYGGSVLVNTALTAARSGIKRSVSLCNDLPDILKPVAEPLKNPSERDLRRAFAKADCVIFHNRDHEQILRDNNLLLPTTSHCVVPGSGVDLKTEKVLELPDLKDGLVVLMSARLQAIRGVFDYIQVARLVAPHAKAVKFIVHALPGADADRFHSAKPNAPYFEVLDAKTELKKVMKRAHLYLCPSHSEGMPGALLQALAAGRPIITTDTPGCRDTVDATVNGYLVPRGDVDALVAAIQALLKRPDLIPAMARASRLKAERRFDQRTVNAALIEALQL